MTARSSLYCKSYNIFDYVGIQFFFSNIIIDNNFERYFACYNPALHCALTHKPYELRLSLGNLQVFRVVDIRVDKHVSGNNIDNIE